MNLYESISRIQAKLKAPKGQFNDFGKYKYRSCEDILEAVKPLIREEGLFMTMSDKIVEKNGKNYVEATVTLFAWETDKVTGQVASVSQISATGYAREEETKKGMDSSQITGAASSYARKYALNGLFCIDDTKDSDATNTGDPPTVTTYEKAVLPPSKHICEVCGAEIPDNEFNYAMKYYKRPLCRRCQKVEYK